MGSQEKQQPNKAKPSSFHAEKQVIYENLKDKVGFHYLCVEVPPKYASLVYEYCMQSHLNLHTYFHSQPFQVSWSLLLPFPPNYTQTL